MTRHCLTSCHVVVTDDLLSLLDAGVHLDHGNAESAEVMFSSEDMFGYSTLRARTSRLRTASKYCSLVFIVYVSFIALLDLSITKSFV